MAQMKFVLAGDVTAAARRFFACSAGVVKALGIVLVVAGRLNVGREGALVQISGCAASFLMHQARGGDAGCVCVCVCVCVLAFLHSCMSC